MQVRQGVSRHVATDENVTDLLVTWGSWHDVPSPGWLSGFVISDPRFLYQFRADPEG